MRPQLKVPEEVVKPSSLSSGSPHDSLRCSASNDTGYNALRKMKALQTKVTPEGGPLVKVCRAQPHYQQTCLYCYPNGVFLLFPHDSLRCSASNGTGYPQRVQENEGFANQSHTGGGSVCESLQGSTALPKYSSRFAYVVTLMVYFRCFLLWCSHILHKRTFPLIYLQTGGAPVLIIRSAIYDM